jgi:hypothetical protein
VRIGDEQELQRAHWRRFVDGSPRVSSIAHDSYIDTR